MQLLWVGLGSALGGMLRYLVGLWISGRVEAGLPIATLVVNLLGSLLLGCLMGILGRIEGPKRSPKAYPRDRALWGLHHLFHSLVGGRLPLHLG